MYINVIYQWFYGMPGGYPYPCKGLYYKIDADVPDEQLEELVQMGTKYSPVFDTITNPVTVTAQLDN